MVFPSINTAAPSIPPGAKTSRPSHLKGIHKRQSEKHFRREKLDLSQPVV